MSLTDRFHIPKLAFAQSFDQASARKALRKLGVFAVAVTVVAALALIFAAGHPIISIWAALALVGWLFVAGAAIASGN
jgi:hypothetical protein